MKTLIIVTHPNINNSVVNKRWVEELEKQPDLFTVHQLYQAYPDGVIDVQKEQQLIEQHDNIVLQFPVYWFNCPPLLKQWLDEVFTYGWAYGSASGHKLRGRKFAVAVSAGVKEEDCAREGRYLHSMQEILLPFEMTANYVGANYLPFYVFYGAEFDIVPQELERSAKGYIDYLQSF
ncbi:NAD(P)H-dependent oxidoreductase [Rahnella woolbedingensis]|uniref:Flavodoxin family protein n=1 Tax=Rahnella woolbedingensis TaxID=1510574 RepID=A0A419N2C8_9GAMM|nr:NAD(P)H-dependent oxidoreductase [Rahnella woolbedingensis]RJT33417.1 flavodoxin family protein [Rahnella woolbedingensis]